MLVKIPLVCSLSPLSLFLWQPDKLWSIAGISLHVTKDSFDLLSLSSISLFLWQPDKLWSIAGISLHVSKDFCGLLYLPLSLFLWQPDKLWSIAGISLHVTKDSCGLLSISPLSLSSYGSLICDLLLGFLYMLLKIPVVWSLSLLYLSLHMAAW